MADYLSTVTPSSAKKNFISVGQIAFDTSEIITTARLSIKNYFNT